MKFGTSFSLLLASLQLATYNAVAAIDFQTPKDQIIGGRGGAATTTTTTSRTTGECRGYFCDKTIDDIVIIETHDSLSIEGLSSIRPVTQNHGLAKQFEDGVRGFHIQLSSFAAAAADDDDDSSSFMASQNGATATAGTKKLRGERNKNDNNDDAMMAELVQLRNQLEKNQHELVLLTLHDNDAVRAVKSLWGDDTMLIKDFDEAKPLGSYLKKGQRVLMMTLDHDLEDPSEGLHYLPDFISENEDQWSNCMSEDQSVANMVFWSGFDNLPCDLISATRMNHFCSPVAAGGTTTSNGNGDDSASPEESGPFSVSAAADAVNTKDRILKSAGEFQKQSYSSGHLPNIISVNFYDQGDAFAALDVLRAEAANHVLCSTKQHQPSTATTKTTRQHQGNKKDDEPTFEVNMSRPLQEQQEQRRRAFSSSSSVVVTQKHRGLFPTDVINIGIEDEVPLCRRRVISEAVLEGCVESLMRAMFGLRDEVEEPRADAPPDTSSSKTSSSKSKSKKKKSKSKKKKGRGGSSSSSKKSSSDSSDEENEPIVKSEEETFEQEEEGEICLDIAPYGSFNPQIVEFGHIDIGFTAMTGPMVDNYLMVQNVTDTFSVTTSAYRQETILAHEDEGLFGSGFDLREFMSETEYAYECLDMLGGRLMEMVSIVSIGRQIMQQETLLQSYQELDLNHATQETVKLVASKLNPDLVRGRF